MPVYFLPSGMPVSKRLFDLLLTIPGLIFISPILLLTSILVWIFNGRPVLFRQQRGGYLGKPFEVYKFRTMRDAYGADGRMLPDAERLTPFGQKLRSLSLDELPELINVLRGEMSLVGPRPLFSHYRDRYTPEQARRHLVLPGVTGWAQINGRNAISWEDKFHLDVWYVDHWSFWLDLKILFITLWKALRREGINQPGQATAEEFMGSPKLVDKDLYRAMYIIRRFEEVVLENFSKGVFYGTTHTYLGQEANAVGVLTHLQPGDIVVSNHRCHGHFLAYGGDPKALYAELMGKSSGVCGGRGGSQHLHWRNFYSNGILGGTIPIATGIAFAEKLKGSQSITVAFLGEGGLGEGVVYETLNLASLWKVPILFVLENNHISQTTPIKLGVAGDIQARFQAFGIPCRYLDSSDILQILPVSGENITAIRNDPGPRALILETCRFGPHSKGDDTRSEEEISQMRRERDPIRIHGSRLDPLDRQEIEAYVERHIQDAFTQAVQDPIPALVNRTDGLVPITRIQ